MKTKANYEWLCSYIPQLKEKTPQEVADALTALGAETEEIKIFDFSNLKLGKITAIEEKNNKNFSVIESGHQKYTVPIKQKISVGNYIIFICQDDQIYLQSFANLGIEEADHEIIVLSNNAEQAEKDFQVLTKSDTLYTLEIPGNRPDWLSVKGLAQSLAVYLDLEFHTEIPVILKETEEIFPIEVQTALCTRYSIRKIKNISVKTSETLIQKRLMLLGMRPINSIVDTSNIVMLGNGQPTHAFDAAKVKGRLIVRTAQGGETITLLNEKTINLHPDDLVICDEEKILALAGIMGGLDSGISKETTDILLESGCFNAAAIRRTSKRHGIKTESSLRFEKNISSSLVQEASDLITSRLINTGSSCSLLNEINQSKPTSVISFDPEKARSYLGAPDIDDTFMKQTLLKLGCTLEKENDIWNIRTPEARKDLKEDVDLIEEIARFYGYNNIPTHTYRPKAFDLNPEKRFEDKIRPLLRGMGISEAITISFRNPCERNFFQIPDTGVINILNPLNSDHTELRTHLFDGLLKSIIHNKTKAFVNSCAFSEVGTVFRKNNHHFIEEKKLAFAVSREQDPYTKGITILNNILAYAKCSPLSTAIDSRIYPFLHPKNSFELQLNNEILGFFGEIHPLVVEKMDLSDKKNFPAPVTCELNLDLLKASYQTLIKTISISEFPPVLRDVTLSIPVKIQGRTLIEEIKKMHSNLKEIEFINIFTNEKLKSEQKKNISLRLRFEADNQSLKGEEIDTFVMKLIQKKW
ncbi:phenylalanyl-tRNA synthetase beta subunit [Brevinema andersonii]|uniref:Phenylalanine--tRNA ligase beta subunit n=1 Tax=Brevinema andersonii TaxID=34097 RepID=A0A1I1D648_BREAD|nr:phenylalanine--tRNA ligase subunit beta [Brevinema andersonii]SFB70401.1 phenylalanyl-tRNA synthetase beta subunit [Brevinema andersonii]